MYTQYIYTIIIRLLVKIMDALIKERLRRDIRAIWLIKTSSKFLDGMKGLHQNKTNNIFKNI